MPDEREVPGLLALLLLTDARRATRTAPDGRLLLLEEQDRAQWDAAAIAEGGALVRAALRGGSPGRFALQAAIAALHAEAASFAETDWPQVLGALRRAAARLAVAGGRAQPGGALCPWWRVPEAALASLATLEGDERLAGYHYLASTKADLLRRLGHRVEAAQAYRDALALVENAQERRFLASRLAEVVAA